jgi:DHA3 family tetracycline resistance protein-like MFS transporter
MIGAVWRPALVRALAHRPFALLWTGQSLSRIGDFLYEVALAWWVLQETGQAAAMGLVLICATVPLLLFLLIGGVASDRLPRGRVMLASDVGRALLLFVMAGLAFTHQLAIWQVCVAAVIFGFVDAFFQPAYAATVPGLVPAGDLTSANALTSLSVQLARVGGPALAAALIAAGGTPLAFALNGLSFALSAACLVPLLRHPALTRQSPAVEAPAVESTPPIAEWVGEPPPGTPPMPPPMAEGPDAPPERRGIWRDLGAGFHTVATQPWLWITIVLASVGNVALAGPYTIAMPFLVTDVLHGDATLLGFLYAIFPIGYMVSGLWLGSRARLRRRGVLAYGGMIGAGLGLATFGLPVSIPVLVVAALINGAALECFAQIWTNLLQERVPADQLGRVTSIDMLGSFGLLPLGFAVAGWATDSIGPALVFLIGGGSVAALAVLALLHPQIRALD